MANITLKQWIKFDELNKKISKDISKMDVDETMKEIFNINKKSVSMFIENIYTKDRLKTTYPKYKITNKNSKWYYVNTSLLYLYDGPRELEDYDEVYDLSTIDGKKEFLDAFDSFLELSWDDMYYKYESKGLDLDKEEEKLRKEINGKQK